ncbi:alpha/beta hydrolase family protein [Croceitalea rosinachiae]|uniref:Prolyl oligopeptidase family serine peptidase n=1 Tax=Croceitalea rosinachiae TaxID=3075596 RepID=A0ABU3AAZ4_9FLAO|nr:prolyl oligopeptidase family serine peptidase [Croceitalea sp. F388]MDT0606707.1 prolyl oligopeptidase family serine peptidase [Croceitalea sp. F388]
MIQKISLLLLLLIQISLSAQKKVLDHEDYKIWSTVQDETIASDGSHVLYSIERGEKDHYLKVQDGKGDFVLEYDRGEKGHFTYDSKYAVFSIKAWKDSVVAMKKRKVKKKDLPKDSLGIFHLENKSLVKIGNIKSYKVPEKWSGYIAYQLEEIKKEKKEEEKDSTTAKEKKKDKPKKVGKDNGYHLVLRNLENGNQDTIKFVKDYTFAKKGRYLAYTTTGATKDDNAGAFVLNLETNLTTTLHQAEKAKYFKLNFSDSGKNLGFVVDTDTTKIQLRPNELYLWQEGKSSAEKLMDNASTPHNYVVSKYGDVHFSKDESKLFFGLAKPPIEKDTTLLDEEIVNVEVWTYDEPKLYTVQELQLKNDTVQSFTTAIHLNNKQVVPLANSIYMNTELGDEGNAKFALVNTSIPYELPSQWTARRDYNYMVINTTTGDTQLELKKVPQMQLSPKANYGYGYNRVDSTWFAYNLTSGSYKALTKNKSFYSEENDYPNFPWAYGSAGWIKDDKAIIIYDRYDLWKFNPDSGAAEKLTNGRSTKTVYRYQNLDDEKKYIDPNEKWILSTFNETSKDAGYAEFNPKNNSVKQLIQGPYRYSSLQKAKMSDALLYSRESFETFPDIRLTNLNFTKDLKLSDANPQQAAYNWGSIELVNWTSLNGKELSGMLVKPENFDPNKKYPLLVNFYERSSDGIHRHRYPKPERSTINYSFFTSRGYVIFNPDVEYRVGYPGESAYNCVIPGVTSLIEKGFIDAANIGVQGHSWGGYQIAYLVTKTDIFKAAESGAPVPNMISAYGGIRWWTGLSRQFQYEHTQSRIGGTPWEYPARYIENSPIFNIDKINTPLLIMHNDADGHVPWYQGIEFFVSLRRLGKPSWFLNYNGEPHWPLKYQNRTDFSIRMAQFFDHYLKGEPKPMWMERGVPPMEKGIKQGYDLLKESDED